MADLEKMDSKSTVQTTPSDSTLNHDAKEFLPIKSNNAPGDGVNRTVSRNSNTAPASLRSISRTRSHNGYGCDDIEEQDTPVGQDVESQGAAEKDPFEVGWDNGENDPANPRSMTMARKWLVVLIVSASSLCV